MNEINILFLNVLKYKDKETGEYKTRFAYLLNDDKAKQNTDNLKGVSEYSYYCDGTQLFDKLNGSDALTSMKLVVEQRPSMRNPLKTVTIIKTVITKHATIELL